MAEAITKKRETVDVVSVEPGKFKVVLHNDDVTPMDFVVSLLMKVFRHSEAEAVQLTLKVHNDGSAVAGVYNYEVAEQKGMESTTLARQQGHPLVIRIEPA